MGNRVAESSSEIIPPIYNQVNDVFTLLDTREKQVGGRGLGACHD